MTLVQNIVHQMGNMGPHRNGVGNNNSNLLWIIIGLLLIIIIYLWYSMSRKPQLTKTELNRDPVESDKIKIALRRLNDNEKQVVEALLSHKGEMLQKDISFELGLTRVQTHRAVQNLVERKIVTTIDHHNTKKITVAQWLIQ